MPIFFFLKFYKTFISITLFVKEKGYYKEILYNLLIGITSIWKKKLVTCKLMTLKGFKAYGHYESMYVNILALSKETSNFCS